MLIISGSRNRKLTAQEKALTKACAMLKDFQIVVGDCPTGVDQEIMDLCREWLVDPCVCEADWETHGKAAGPIRNMEMFRQAGDDVAVLAFPSKESKGTRHVIRIALEKQLPLIVVEENGSLSFG